MYRGARRGLPLLATSSSLPPPRYLLLATSSSLPPEPLLAAPSFVPLDHVPVGRDLSLSLPGAPLGPGAVRRELPRLAVVPPHELEQLEDGLPVARRIERN